MTNSRVTLCREFQVWYAWLRQSSRLPGHMRCAYLMRTLTHWSLRLLHLVISTPYGKGLSFMMFFVL